MERNPKAPDAEVSVRNGVGGGGVPSERRRGAPLYRELGSRPGLAVKGMSSISSDYLP